MQRRQQWKEKLVAEIKGQAVYIKGFRVFPGERRFKQTSASSVSFLILRLCTASCRDLETLWPNGEAFQDSGSPFASIQVIIGPKGLTLLHFNFEKQGEVYLSNRWSYRNHRTQAFYP